jgi:hypothetical protein
MGELLVTNVVVRVFDLPLSGGSIETYRPFFYLRTISSQ